VGGVGGWESCEFDWGVVLWHLIRGVMGDGGHCVSRIGIKISGLEGLYLVGVQNSFHSLMFKSTCGSYVSWPWTRCITISYRGRRQPRLQLQRLKS
jgi:hypothetical protein